MTQILYKQKSSIPKGETIRGMNFVSPLVEYKFYNQSSKQVYNKYFVDAGAPLQGTFNVISDVNSDISDEIKKTVKDFYYYNKVEPQYFAFRVIVFSSTEMTKLKECFDVSEPSDNEILIFVEDNKNDSASGTYGAIKISPKIIATLGSQNRLAYDVKDNKNIYDELKKILPELTNDQIKSLLHNGYIEDTRINAIKTWLKVASFFSSGIDAIFPGLGILTNDILRKATSDSLAEVIEKIEEARLEEYRWQPTPPKTENGEEDKNYNYQPLISVDEKDNATINIAQFSSLLQKKLDDHDAFIKAKLKISQKFDEKGEPNNLLEFLYLNYFKAYKVAKSTISKIQELSDIEILKYGVKAYNALLCGVWNGLVDAVSGLFAMVKMIYDGITLGKDFVQNIDKYLPTLLEQFDEAIQAIEKLSFTEIAKYIYGKLKDVNLTFDPIACAYFVGYAYGFILSLIIEIILTVVATGATLTIPVIVEKLSEALFGIFRLGFSAAKGIAKAIRTFSRFVVKSIEDVIKGFQELLNFLKKGWDEIKNIIDEAFKSIKQNFSSKIKEVFSQETETDELFRRISKKIDSTGKQILNTSELKKLRLYLKKELGIELEIVSRTNPATKELWRKMALGQTQEGNRVLGMFKATTGKSRKFGMTLEGPKLYVLDEAYAYTIEHELKHAKLWHKMTKEFPELEAQFNSLSQRLHEEYVLSELVKAGKWETEDLLLDLNTINKKYRKPFGLPEVNLDYFKNWKLQEQIK